MKNLILLHGALGAKSQFNLIAEQLKDEYNLYTMNFQGHGGRLSDQPFSIELFSNDLIEFMDENSINKAMIFGYSMGGYVALKTAKNHPERIEKILTLGTKFDWNPKNSVRVVKMMNPDKIEEKVPKFAAYLKSLHEPNDWKEVMNKTSDMMLRLGKNPSLKSKDFDAINHQCEIGLGDKDDMVSCEETLNVVKQMANAKYYLMKNTLHPIDKIDPINIINKIREVFR